LIEVEIMRALLIAVILGLGSQNVMAVDAGPSAEEIKTTVRKALPSIEKGGVSWIKTKKCVSCHRTSFLVWSHQEARQIGVPVDAKKLAEWTNWSLEKSLSKREKDGKIVGTSNLDGLRQLLLAEAENSEKPTPKQKKSYVSLTSLIVNGQLKNGSWKPNGQLPFQKRPLPETTEVSTMWAIAALETRTNSDAIQAAQKRAADWIKATTAKNKSERKSVEWLMLRVLLDHQSGDAKSTASSLKKLLAEQNTDGGWPWLRGDKSDALSTGQVLYVLSRIGKTAANKNVRRAQTFLVRTQLNDGSWAVPGTKKKKKDRPQPTANYWGTAWAVIGLAKTFPKKQ
jgi:hypothetical protein